MSLPKILISALVLLVVVAGVIYILNPSEGFKQKRDQQRITDLENLKKAIDLYLTKNSKTAVVSVDILCEDCSKKNEVYAYRQIKVASISTTAKASRYVNAQGWLPVDFSKNMKPGETPLKLLPIDPREGGYKLWQSFPLIKSIYAIPADLVYTFTPGEEGKYKLTAKMESEIGLQKAKEDKGTLDDRYEIGSDLSLQP